MKSASSFSMVLVEGNSDDEMYKQRCRVRHPAIHFMIKYTKDGRTVLTGKDYQALRKAKFLAADKQCEWCANDVQFFAGHLHHKAGRGMGGGKRDDTVESTVFICSNCHELEHRPETIH